LAPGGLDARHMPDPFDGAGKPHRGSSYRGWFLVLVVSVVLIALLWLAYAPALDVVPPRTPSS
jgi:hypothetical protein